MKSYYILNIIETLGKKRVNTVDAWMDRSFAPIFFGFKTVNEIIKNKEPTDAYLFCSRSLDSGWSESKIISLGPNDIYIYSPIEEVKDYSHRYQANNCLIKGCEVKLIHKEPIKKSPLVLSSIKSNTFLGRGTFREISGRSGTYDGNILAVNYLSQKEKKAIKVNSFKEYLYCLSSLEFETLIAKLFEEMGFFVSAYKGGFLKDLDLVIKNNEVKPLKLFSLKIDPGQILSIQTKLSMNSVDQVCDLSVSINEIDNEKHIGISRLENGILNYPKTKKWLEESLYWVTINGA